MPMALIRKDQFTGSNNISKPERLPEGAVVDAVNFDFTVGGKAELRTGFNLVQEYGDIRAVFPMGDSLALVAGSTLKKIKDGVSIDLAEVAQGQVAAVWHNSKLYLNTVSDSFLIGDTVESWSAPAPSFDVEVVAGGFKPGVYKIAVTAIYAGVETGCLPMVVTLGEGQSIRVNVADDRECRVYCSVENGQSLYSQGIAHETNLLSRPVDDTYRLETDGLAPFPFCSILESHNSIIIGASGKYVFYTKPMLPHLHDPEKGYLQFSKPVTLIKSVGSGVYVCADKTYYITGLGGDDLLQRTVLDFGSIAGTSVTLPNGNAAWFSKYGQVIAGEDGNVSLINRESYAPTTANNGASGFLEHNGNQMVITTMRGEASGSRLASSDHWELEVIE